ncbi:MAG: hypothetical protein AAF527_12505 [Pseudomonadota bacterium]
MKPRKPPAKRDFAKEKARKSARALAKIRKLQRLAEASGAELSDWEGEFLSSLEERVETYGAAFRDPDKGAIGESLSMLQAQKLREVERKARDARRAGPKPPQSGSGAPSLTVVSGGGAGAKEGRGPVWRR